MYLNDSAGRQTPELVPLAIILFLIVVAVNFSFLTIRIDLKGITVSYGLIRHFTPWKQVGGYYRDEATSLSYGGFGIRMTTVNGRSRLAYTTLGAPRIVIEQTGARMQEFAFSTRYPEKVMEAIEFGLKRE